MHVTSYGMSVTTLEEVFLKVASDATDHNKLGHLGQLRRESSASVMDASESVERDQVSRSSRNGPRAACGSHLKVHEGSISLPEASLGYERMSCLNRTYGRSEAICSFSFFRDNLLKEKELDGISATLVTPHQEQHQEF